MGSGDWFKTIIGRKKSKQDKSGKSKGPSDKQSKESSFNKLGNGFPNDISDNAAAIRIQTAFRAYKARKSFRTLKSMERIKGFAETQFVRNQASNTLGYLQMWNRVQSQISARRLYMVTEGWIKQKKLETQLKVEAKLHDLEVEWCGGSETMEEIIARIQQREEAALKRERAMAYAFSHQWRVNNGQVQGQYSYELGKGNWGWSWMERWVAARPWEARLPAPSISPSKPTTREASNVGKKLSKSSNTSKSTVPNGKRPVRRLPYPSTAEKALARERDSEIITLVADENNSSTINLVSHANPGAA